MKNDFIEGKLIEFLNEDILTGDITTDNIFDDNHLSTAKLILKENDTVILCGIDIFLTCFKLFDDNIQVKKFYDDGDIISNNEIVVEFTSKTKNILKCERTALNILQRMTGIATKSYRLSNILKGSKISILDTRKTLPGFRYFDKYAVKTGGSKNHRFGLYDMVLIKDNHIKSAGSISNAVKKIKSCVSPYVKIEVETENLSQVKEALDCSVDIIMLDNMDNGMIKKAVEIIRKYDNKVLIEVSGNITETRINELKSFDIDFISSGLLTNSVKSVDFSLKIKD